MDNKLGIVKQRRATTILVQFLKPRIIYSPCVLSDRKAVIPGKIHLHKTELLDSRSDTGVAYRQGRRFDVGPVYSSKRTRLVTT